MIIDRFILKYAFFKPKIINFFYLNSILKGYLEHNYLDCNKLYIFQDNCSTTQDFIMLMAFCGNIDFDWLATDSIMGLLTHGFQRTLPNQMCIKFAPKESKMTMNMVPFCCPGAEFAHKIRFKRQLEGAVSAPSFLLRYT